jgi:hypothetical protein
MYLHLHLVAHGYVSAKWFTMAEVKGTCEELQILVPDCMPPLPYTS